MIGLLKRQPWYVWPALLLLWPGFRALVWLFGPWSRSL